MGQQPQTQVPVPQAGDLPPVHREVNAHCVLRDEWVWPGTRVPPAEVER